MSDLLFDSWNIILMVVGFSLVIFIHELGHFVAARWAGIRCHAFAIGFGRAVVSYRKGLGFRVGSSEREYAGLLADQGLTPSRGHLDDVSDTEYRLNWIPFGGYVRMLGQEDGNPNASSTASDSYSRKPVWKRMIVISGGVIMNVILAAVLFMAVFMIGMKEVPPIVGEVVADSPAAEAGIQTGDVILKINGSRAQTFTDLMIASAMSGPDQPVEIEVQRGDERLTFAPTPSRTEGSPLKSIGVRHPDSLRLMEFDRNAPRERLVRQFAEAGLNGVEPAMHIVAIDAIPVEERVLGGDISVRTMEQLREAARNSGGAPLVLTFQEDETGRTVEIAVELAPELNTLSASFRDLPVNHLLGLVPLMKVLTAQERGTKQGLRAGDVFLAVGNAEYPSIPKAIETVQSRAGEPLRLKLLRDGEVIEQTVNVDGEGRIGFLWGHALETPIVAKLPRISPDKNADMASSRIEPPIEPGSRIVAVNGVAVDSFLELRVALQKATRMSHGPEGTSTISLSSTGVGGQTQEPTTHTWTLNQDEIGSLQSLAWSLDQNFEMQFQIATITLRADNPFDAMVMGVQKTHRIMMLTYLTFKRLIQGTVSPKELRGPVGITHIGSQYAAQGFVYLLFFLALISANLAVINFLPIPIVDGGLFVMLLYEGVTRRPVPIVVQNVATAVGLALIITAFIFVTVQDIGRLF